MGWEQNTLPKTAAIGALDDLLEAVEDYLNVAERTDECASETAAFERLIMAHRRAKTMTASTRVDL